MKSLPKTSAPSARRRENVQQTHDAQSDDVADDRPLAPRCAATTSPRMRAVRPAKRRETERADGKTSVSRWFSARDAKILGDASGIDLGRAPRRALHVLAAPAGAALEARRVMVHEDAVADRERNVAAGLARPRRPARVRARAAPFAGYTTP